MASKSYAAVIHDHLKSRFEWWYSLYTSLLEIAAAYERDQPFSSNPHGDAALLECLNIDTDYAYQMAKALAEELGRAEREVQS